MLLRKFTLLHDQFHGLSPWRHGFTAAWKSGGAAGATHVQISWISAWIPSEVTWTFFFDLPIWDSNSSSFSCRSFSSQREPTVVGSMKYCSSAYNDNGQISRWIWWYISTQNIETIPQKLVRQTFLTRTKHLLWAQFKNHADPGHLHRFLSVLEILTGPPVRGRQLWRRTGNCFLFFFNFMFVIWDSRHEDLQLFWRSFKLWFLCISLITTRNFNGSNPHGSLALANAYQAVCSGYLGVSCDMNIFNRPVL